MSATDFMLQENVYIGKKKRTKETWENVNPAYAR